MATSPTTESFSQGVLTKYDRWSMNFFGYGKSSSGEKDALVRKIAYHRVSAFFEIFVKTFAYLGDFVVGVGHGIYSVFPGKNEKFRERQIALCDENLKSFGSLFPSLFFSCLKIVSKNGVRDVNAFEEKELRKLQAASYEAKSSVAYSRGFFSGKIYEFQKTLLDKRSIRDSLLIKKAILIVSIPCLAIARTAEFALGLVAAALSLLTLGSFERINKFASRNLAITKIVYDDILGNLYRGFAKRK